MAPQRIKRSEKESVAPRRASEKTVPISTDIKEGPTLGEWSRRGPRSDTSSEVLEQAWIMKMASEIARRVYDEKNRNPGFWEGRDDVPRQPARLTSMLKKTQLAKRANHHFPCKFPLFDGWTSLQQAMAF